MIESKVSLVVLSVFCAAILAEFVLGAIDYHYTPLRIQVLKAGDWRYYHAFEDHHFRYDPLLIWRPREGVSVFNIQGYRGQPIPPTKVAGTVRILALGDSNTLGFEGHDAPNWPADLDALLGPPVTVINAGVWGYTSFQGLRRLQEALVFEPDVVLVAFGANDAARLVIPDARFVEQRPRTFALDRSLMLSRTGQLLLTGLDRVRAIRGERVIPRVSVAEYEANLQAMINLSKSQGVAVVLLTRPFLTVLGGSWWLQSVAVYNHATLAVARRNHIPSIDLASRFQGSEMYFHDESHFSQAGHQRAARMIAKQLKQRHLVPR